MANVDPELVRLLSMSAGDEPVEAVVRLRPTSGAPAPSPDETERLTHELVNRTQKESGQQQGAVNVFKYLGSFAISARPSFLRTLIAQPEVASALANRQPGSGEISPVEKRPATIDDIGRPPDVSRSASKNPAKPVATRKAEEAAKGARRAPAAKSPGRAKAKRAAR